MGIGARNNLLLDQRAGWRAAALDKTVLAHGGCSLRLQTLPGSARPLVDSAGDLGGLVLPLGLAVDDEDNIYILDSAANVVKRFNRCTLQFETLPCIGGPGDEPRQVRQAEGIAISRRDDLYVVDTGNRRVQIFALKGLPLRAIWGPFKLVRSGSDISVERTRPIRPAPSASGDCELAPSFEDGTWQPSDIALARDGRAFISDYANGLIHVFDPYGHWQMALTGEGQNAPALDKATRIALDRDCNLYVLQEGKDYVTVLDADGNFKTIITQNTGLKRKFCPVEVAVDADGNLYVGEKLGRCVCVYCPGPDGCHQYAGECQGFDGVGMALAFDKAGNPIVCDPDKKRIVCFAPAASYVTQGLYWSDSLDSRTYRCTWHRVVMCADIPAGTELRVDTFTSESAKTVTEVQSLPEERWATGEINSQTGEGEWDCLVTSPPGRYLWLRLTLIGDGTSTPSAEWIRVYFPRASSLQYLPATYSDDPISRDFLDRFLSIFDTINASFSDEITLMARLFDPAATPAGATNPGDVDFLMWLAGWLDLTLDRHWPVEKRRELVKQAYQLYRLRGTPAGLRLHVKLYTGAEPQILEHFQVRRWLYVDQSRLGDQTVLWGRDVIKRLQLDGLSQVGSFQLVDTGDPLRDPFYAYAHQFTVFVPVRADPSDVEQQTLKRIVEMAKPADALATIEYVQPRFRIGIQAFIGVDTVIGQYPSGVTTDQGRLGYDTVLGPSADEAEPPRMRIGKSTRIGTSTLID